MNKALQDIFIKCRFSPNSKQIEAIENISGPLLIIAGPGSGKTHTLIFRTLNLLLLHNIPPDRILLCTFTEKAATRLKELLRLELIRLNKKVDIYKLRTGTIHGICNELIQEFLNKTPLGKNYEVLEELTQYLFLYDHFEEILKELKYKNGLYFGRWRTKWSTIEAIVPFINKITEELVDIDDLKKNKNQFIPSLYKAYVNYRKELFDNNMIDFAHMQKIVLELLRDKEVGSKIRSRIDYVMVDEYQDTNYVQEQIMLELVKDHKNLCVVGDEDQGLYRFRGATVRNILEFEKNFKKCKRVVLDINYRSHKKIIELYNTFMEGCNWQEENGKNFRFEKSIKPNPQKRYADYPSTIAIWGQNYKDEANKVVNFIKFLKDNKVINDLNEIAILLKSVRPDHSGHYTKAFEEAGIPCYAPRARGYFENYEVRELIGCFVFILNFYGKERQEIKGYFFREFYEFLDDSLNSLLTRTIRRKEHPLAGFLRSLSKKINNIPSGKALEEGLLDIFYQILAYPPFSNYLEDEEKARNLAIFSNLLQLFQNYYGYPVISRKRLQFMVGQFFNSYLKFLYEGGINEYEDPYDILPKGKVQLMTIHQAKGLEFPVVIVGSLDKRVSSAKQVDHILQPFYHREEFESLNRITEFDRMRLFYVAFSRAKDFLGLTCGSKPKDYFLNVWETLLEWPKVDKEAIKRIKVSSSERPEIKREFGLTTHINVYDTCPRQYQMYKEYEFSAARAAQIFFGTIVHQTIEDIHRHILENGKENIDKVPVEEYFERNYQTLMRRGIHSLGKTHKQEAFHHILNYFKNNQEQLKRVIETEVPIAVEKDTYYLSGKIDLLLGEDGKLEVLDFKSQRRPEDDNDPRFGSCKKQLSVYAHALDVKHGTKPERLYVYWTGEENKNKALMEFGITDQDIDEAGRHFDEVVEKINKKDFTIKTKPPQRICLECDFRHNCKVK